MRAVAIRRLFASGPEIGPSQRVTASVSREGYFLVEAVLRESRVLLGIIIADLSDVAFFVVGDFDQVDASVIEGRAAGPVKVRR